MANIDTQHTWTFTGSTAATKAINLRNNPLNITVVYNTSSGCTASLSFLHKMGSSAGAYSIVDPSTAMSSRAALTKFFSGPMQWVKPRLETLTSGSTNIVTVYLAANS